jgi:hypothetical protein
VLRGSRSGQQTLEHVCSSSGIASNTCHVPRELDGGDVSIKQSFWDGAEVGEAMGDPRSSSASPPRVAVACPPEPKKAHICAGTVTLSRTPCVTQQQDIISIGREG